MVVIYFSCNFDVIVRRGKPYLPMPPSWPILLRRLSFVLCVFLFQLFVHNDYYAQLLLLEEVSVFSFGKIQDSCAVKFRRCVRV